MANVRLALIEAEQALKKLKGAQRMLGKNGYSEPYGALAKAIDETTEAVAVLDGMVLTDSK